jgi:hypothetical protein
MYEHYGNGKIYFLKAIRAKLMKNRPHVFEIKLLEIVMIYCSVHLCIEYYIVIPTLEPRMRE